MIRSLQTLSAVVASVLLAACLGTAWADEASTPPSNAPVPATELLSRLKAIADGGTLLRPEHTADILGVPLSKTASTQQVPMTGCTPPATSLSIDTLTLDPPASWWYRAQASAPGKLPIPAAFINQASVSADPSFHYDIRHVVQCTDRFGIQDVTEAQLSFGGLPSFACLSPAQIFAALPGAVNQSATDGVSFVAYAGLLDDEAGTSLRFFFRMGVGCALSATIEQSRKSGLRALRARSVSTSCRLAANRRWCASNGPVTWSDGAALERMNLDADHVCASEDSLYRKEPFSGARPEPVVQRKLGALPCEFP